MAILAVLYYHSSSGLYLHSWRLLGGWIGVDAFFVLSGYLITTLLLREWGREGSVGLRAFYARRVLRLFPALATLLIGGALVVAIVGSNAGGLPYGRAVLPTVFYAGNWFEARGGNPLGILGHTWSLALEEQFYLLWPPVLAVLLARRRSPRRIAAGLVPLIAAAAVYRALSHLYISPDAAVYHFGRADGVLIGSAIALLLFDLPFDRIPSFVRRPTLPSLAAVALVVAAIRLDSSSELWQLGGLSVVYVLVGFVLVHLVTTDSRSPLRSVLSAGPLVWIGRVSYGLYLYHIPVNYLIHHTRVSELPGGVEVVVHTAVTFLAAWVSFVFIERPALRLKRRWRPDERVPAVGIASAEAQP